MDLEPEYLDDPIEDPYDALFEHPPLVPTRRYLTVRIEELPGVRIDHRCTETECRRFVIITDRNLREVLERPRETELAAVARPVDVEYLQRSARSLLQQLAARIARHPCALPASDSRAAAPIGETLPARAASAGTGRLVFYGRRPGVEHCLELLTDQGGFIRVSGTLQLKDALEQSGVQLGDRIRVERRLSVVGPSASTVDPGEAAYSVTKLDAEDTFEPSPVDWEAHR